nr:hypothetical protein CFP56_28707 [Quercus suber]
MSMDEAILSCIERSTSCPTQASGTCLPRKATRDDPTKARKQPRIANSPQDVCTVSAFQVRNPPTPSFPPISARLLFRSQQRLALRPARTIDPIFAVSIGIAAAAVRINREEKEQGRSTAQSYESLKRRIAMVWAGEPQEEAKREGFGKIFEVRVRAVEEEYAAQLEKAISPKGKSAAHGNTGG